MSAFLFPTSNQMRADNHSVTSSEPKVPTAQAASPTEVIQDIIPTELGDLHSWFGLDAPVPVSTALETPTDSRVGPHGGLIPKFSSRVHPGPETPGPQAAPVASGLLESIRKLFRA